MVHSQHNTPFNLPSLGDIKCNLTQLPFARARALRTSQVNDLRDQKDFGRPRFNRRATQPFGYQLQTLARNSPRKIPSGSVVKVRMHMKI